MTLKKLSGLLLISLLSTNAFAVVKGYESYFNVGRFIATLGLGPAWARPGEVNTFLYNTSTVLLAPYPRNPSIRFVSTTDGTRTVATGELFLGFLSCINSVVEGQFGLVIGTSSKVSVRGFGSEDFEVFNLPFAPIVGPQNIGFFHTPFNYSFTVHNSRVAAKAKFLYDPSFYDLFPYLSGSVGVGFNRVSNFKINPVGPLAPVPVFPNQTKEEVSYSIGVGLETTLDPGWRLGLGYEFYNWGRANLGSVIDGHSFSSGPGVSHLHVHAVLATVSLLF